MQAEVAHAGEDLLEQLAVHGDTCTKAVAGIEDKLLQWSRSNGTPAARKIARMVLLRHAHGQLLVALLQVWLLCLMTSMCAKAKVLDTLSDFAQITKERTAAAHRAVNKFLLLKTNLKNHHMKGTHPHPSPLPCISLVHLFAVLPCAHYVGHLSCARVHVQHDRLSLASLLATTRNCTSPLSLNTCQCWAPYRTS